MRVVAALSFASCCLALTAVAASLMNVPPAETVRTSALANEWRWTASPGAVDAKPSSGGVSARLAPSEPRSITAAEDITGGRESLFSDYRRQLAIVRDEAGYATFVRLKDEALGALLDRAGVPSPETAAAVIAEAMKGAVLGEGAAVDVAAKGTVGPSGQDVRIRLTPEPGLEIVAWRKDGAWHVRRDETPVTTSYVTAASVMTDSLFGAGARAEVPREIMARLANLFLYDVDFVRDIRAEDRFEVVYEVRHDEDGRPLGTGDIVFAAMTWRGGREAKGYYRFKTEDGGAEYFDAGGASAQRLLMKTPIEGARVTSRFGKRRHPTLGFTKAHKGVDFGARSGTPIMAAGDGTVVKAGPLGTYGNFLLIRHTGGYETAYAHLRGFAGGVKAGSRVKQGDVVAYVGSTGRSTGPHLHYEVRAKGRHVNPMDLDVATGSVLAGTALGDFTDARRIADAMRAKPLAVGAGD